VVKQGLKFWIDALFSPCRITYSGGLEKSIRLIALLAEWKSERERIEEYLG